MTTTVEEGTTLVYVDLDDLDTAVQDGGVISLTGTSTDGTQRIRFAGDHRSMLGLLAMVEEVGHVPAVVEDWQVLGTHTVEPS